MIYDFQTLFSVTVFVSAVAGLLLLFAWIQNRSIVSLGMWGSAFLVNAVAMDMLVAQMEAPNVWRPVCIADTLWLSAYGMMWAAARAFEGRRTPLIATLAGALIWLIACQFDGFFASLQARMTLVSAVIATYVLLCASEVWRGRDPDLMSRWPTIVLLIVHGSAFLVRTFLVGILPYPSGIAEPSSNWLPIGAFELLFHTVCMSVLLVNMAKERAELLQRKASQRDPLTGVANRRAFFDEGEALLRRMRMENRTAALLLFDLDHFKAINDTYGHQAGDRALSMFCAATQSMLRPRDLFGRYAGDEFACLLPDISLADAALAAERIRIALAQASLAGTAAMSVTVSVGVALSDERTTGIDDLFTVADRALYRAKSKGRNRIDVNRGRLSLVDTAKTMSDVAPMRAAQPVQ